MHIKTFTAKTNAKSYETVLGLEAESTKMWCLSASSFLEAQTLPRSTFLWRVRQRLRTVHSKMNIELEGAMICDSSNPEGGEA
jgi:hypothetical protein